MDQAEITLIQRAQAGDRPAFEELVRRYDGRILQVAYGILGNRDDAYDAYQNTFIRAYTHLRAFRFESAFGTWLTRIAINQSINLRKKQRWRHWLSLDAPGASVHAPAPEADTEPARALINQEIDTHVQQSIETLSDRERAVFVLKHMHGYKIREIAGMIDCAEGTVKNYLFRATRKMRTALQPYYEDFTAS